MDLSTAKYIMDYIYFNRANDTAFQYHKKVSFVKIVLLLLLVVVESMNILRIGKISNI